jgi:hypothetical protein
MASSPELGRADLYGEANAIGSVVAEATTGSFRDAGTLADCVL